MIKNQVLELDIERGAFISEFTREISEDVTLIVPPSCEAVFAEKGVTLGVFGEGAHDFNEHRGFFARLFGRSKKTIARIYCVNKSVPVLGYWGTPSRIEFRERETGIPVSAGLCGTYRVTVDNALKLFKNLLGVGRTVDVETIAEYYGSEISAIVRDRFYKLVCDGDIPFFELAGDLARLATLIRGDVDELLAEAGLRASAFTVDSVSIDDDVKKLVRDNALKAYGKRAAADERAEREAELDRLREEQRIKDERAYEREIWERREAHERAVRHDEIELEKARAKSDVKPDAERKSAFCPQCGTLAGGGAYCHNCGAPLNATCVCGAKLLPGARFCPECGRKASGN